jgi:hypothetical protein
LIILPDDALFAEKLGAMNPSLAKTIEIPQRGKRRHAAIVGDPRAVGEITAHRAKPTWKLPSLARFSLKNRADADSRFGGSTVGKNLAFMLFRSWLAASQPMNRLLA